MVRTEAIYEVFIASPNDVKSERNIISDVIKEIDDLHTGVSLKPIMWETDSLRDFTLSDTQARLNQLVHRCDLMVAVFGGTLGTPTDRAASGAIEEIQESNQNVMLFLKEGNIEYLRTELANHFPKMSNRLYHTYDGEENFRKQIFRAISKWFNETIKESKPADHHEPQAERQVPSRNLGREARVMTRPTPVSPESSVAKTSRDAIPEEVANEPTSSQPVRKNIQGSVADLVSQGLLAAGAQISCEPRMGERYTATVLASGDIQLPDGQTFNNPSAVGRAVAGRQVNGWEQWHTEDGRTLRELRSRLQFASDHLRHTTGAVQQAESVDPVSSETGTGGVPAALVSQQPASPTRARTRIPGSVADLVSQGLLAAGAQISCEPRMGERYTATVLASGEIQLPDGRTFNSLSAAGQAVAVRGVSGWRKWRTEDGRTLRELRSRLQFASDHLRHTTGAVQQAESVDPVSSETGTGGVPAALVSQQPASPTRARTRIPGSVADLVSQGLLAAGAQISCESRMGERYTATVLASGNIQLPDGQTFNNPSAVGRAVAGRQVNGWEQWRTEDGRTLHELRSKLRK